MSDIGPEDNTQADVFGLTEVRELLRLISESDVTEIQIERGAAKLHIKRGTSHNQPFVMTPALAASLSHVAAASPPASAQFHPQHAAPIPAATPAVPSAPADTEPPPGGSVITAPMVGTYYSAPSPKDPVYVNEGDTINPDDVIGIVEAMKIMNEIVYEGDKPGRIARILVTNSQPVEYGQPLMIVEPL
jgi:acetyl-CoA carboxylase biotin carboxyl carrier protein